MRVTRRNFLKISALVSLGAIALKAVSLANPLRRATAKGKSTSQDISNKQWVMVIDHAKCDGCADAVSKGELPACTAVCAKTHFLPKRAKSAAEPIDPAEPHEWIKVYQVEHNPAAGEHPFVRPCMHCENPPCLHVCPVGATFRRSDGLVLIDNTICIGCRLCMAACPYEARYFNWGEPEIFYEEDEFDYEAYKATHTPDPDDAKIHLKGTVGKCDFCGHNTKHGLLPHCIGACPKKALYFGDLNEDVVTNGVEFDRFGELIHKSGGYRHKEELGTRPRVYYLPPRRE